MMLIYKIDRRNRGFIDEKTRRNSCNILEDVADRTEDPGVINTIDILCDQAERILENNAYSGNPFMDVQKEMPYQREAPKIGRNDPCPCGSGKKYKKCCGK